LPTQPATGTVTYRGQPVVGAQIGFMPDDSNSGKPALGVTDAEGRFRVETPLGGSTSVKGALIGEYTVTVMKRPAASNEPAMSPDQWSKLSKEEQARQRGSMVAKTSRAEESAGASNSLASELPAKYLNAKTSNLKASVKAGDKNDFTFELVD
jgi:hypothetical protein